MTGRGDFAPLISVVGAFALVGAGLLVNPGGPKTVRPISEKAAPEQTLVPTRVPARLWQDPVEASWDRVNTVIGEGREEKLWKQWSLALDLLRGELNESDGTDRLLPIVIQGSSYPETREMRLRSRYAVRAAMDHLGFRPLNASELDFLPVPIDTKTGEILKIRPADTEIRTEFVPVTYEVFATPRRNAPRRDRIFVFWIDARIVNVSGVPKYECVMELLKTIRKDDGFKTGILTLQGSDDLIAVLRRDEKLNLVYPKATAPRRWLFQEAGLKDEKFPNIQRPIPTDDYSLATLVLELERRIPQPGEKREVWLIAEHDTFYSRAMVETFRKQLKERGGDGVVVRYISYLKGIDGNLPDLEPAYDKRQTEPIRNLTDLMQGLLLPKKDNQRIFDRRQVDYLQRLANRLRQEQLTRGFQDRVQAIGVLGSDVFDKLMVLQIFRQQFPDVVYFTTDLDAVFLHNNIPEATRNLVIASPFGLDPGLKAGEGPEVDFRDSYQTSLFWAVVGMLNGEKAKEAAPNGIGIWEVGRSGFLKLWQGSRVTWKAGDFDSEQPPIIPKELGKTERAFSFRFLLPVLGIACVLLQAAFAWLVLRRLALLDGQASYAKRKRLGGRMIRFIARGGVRPWLSGRAVLVVLLLILVFGLPKLLRNADEPFLWFEGISVWPSILIRLILAGMGFVYFVGILADIELSRMDLEREASREWANPVLRSARRSYAMKPSVNPMLRTTVWLSVGWFIFLFGVMKLLEPFSSTFYTPARGFWAFLGHEISILLAVGTLVLLTWLAVVQQIRLRDYLYKVRKRLQRSRVLLSRDMVDRIAAHTTEVSQSVVYPFVILILLLASRHTVFDAWNIPPALWVTCGIILLVLLAAGFSLGRAAQQLKKSQQGLVGELKREVVGDEAGTVWQHWQDASGPFGSWQNQPVFRAVFVGAAALGLGFLEPVLKTVTG